MHLWSDILRFILSNISIICNDTILNMNHKQPPGNQVIEGHNIKHNIMTAGVSIVVA